MSTFLLMLRLVLVAVFGVAGVAKLFDRAGSRQSMREFGVPAALSGPLALALPWAELAFAIALIPRVSAWWGAVGALALLTAFTAAILVNLARGRTPDCHCFGRIHSEPVGWSTVVRNGVLIATATFVVVQGVGSTGPGLFEWMFALDRSSAILLAVATVLVAIVAAAVVAVTQLLAQNGRLMLRIEAVEARLGGRAALETPEDAGLPLETEAPAFSAPDLNQQTVTLDSLSEAEKPILLVFSEPGCGACEQAMPDIARWQRDHGRRLRVVVISRGDRETNHAKAATQGVRDVLLQADREIAEAYRVVVTPSAVLVKKGLIASPVAAGYDAIRNLVFANTLPDAVKRGEVTPKLDVPSLEGDTLDIATLKGRPTALLFWDPACGFCQAMLSDLRSWERTRHRSAPELIVVSTGSPETNRAQRLRSRILLDPSFGTGQVFGVTGTPSAVLIDEKGRFASDVGVGAPAVFELLARRR